MRRPLLAILLAASCQVQAQATSDMDALLRDITQSSQASRKLNGEREARFLRNKNEQGALLAKAEAELGAANTRVSAVKARFAASQQDVSQLKKQLAEQVGDTGQIYAGIAQSASEFRGQLGNALTTSQFPDRLAVLDKLAAAEEIPNITEIERLWFLYAQEAAESGRISRFRTTVRDVLGEKIQTDVVRIGQFSALTAEGHLILQPETGELSVLERQPEDGIELAKAFTEATEGLHDVLVDPSRGDLLRLIADRPTLADRLHQGGEVGYVIIAIGVLGAVVATWQFGFLVMVGRRVGHQLRDITRPNHDNPLGRVLLSLKGDPTGQDPEVLETRLSEAVLRETPKLERFQSLLRMIVAAGPLLGLLGTVVGMIITFQVITEAGASDPKLMAEGISRAMIATALGLMIAIPLLFVNTFITARSRTLIQVLDEQAAGLLARQLEAMGKSSA